MTITRWKVGIFMMMFIEEFYIQTITLKWFLRWNTKINKNCLLALYMFLRSFFGIINVFTRSPMYGKSYWRRKRMYFCRKKRTKCIFEEANLNSSSKTWYHNCILPHLSQNIRFSIYSDCMHGKKAKTKISNIHLSRLMDK